MLRPPAIRSDLSGSHNRMIIEEVVNSLKSIVYQWACVNSHYGRIEDCPCSGLMDHVRVYENTPPLNRRKYRNTTTTISLMGDVATRREHIAKMIKNREAADSQGSEALSSRDSEVLLNDLEGIGR